ncbi:MAG: glutamine--tRNA ligase/YqeY domain fusion protein [Bradymonadia bacterium]
MSGSNDEASGTPEEGTRTHFIQDIINADRAEGKHDGRVQTRFPPEPNGYLHIGHAKSICLNFGLAEQYGGVCNLRFDDTNPVKEDTEYVESIQRDIRWLGFSWPGEALFASDYFEKLYEMAEQLITAGKAYVCDLSEEGFRAIKGDFHNPGTNSPYRDRSPEESLDLFRRMRAGEFEDGSKVLRAKIDMASPNMNLRDPTLYRIRRAHHHRTGDTWCIYPMYDFAHGQSDWIERVTHSICTLEFEAHRPLYDWCLESLGAGDEAPRQYEFARLGLNYTVMSKRKLLRLVQEDHVAGWDDPRMPTLSGLRRAGYTAESIRNFAEGVGVARANSTIDVALLEHSIRDDLNEKAPRAMAVLDPLKLVITNYPEGEEETFHAPVHPQQPDRGKRPLPFSRELWIDREDFAEVPPRKWRRLTVGQEVRLRNACYVTVNEVIKDDAGEITELRATWDPESRGGTTADGRKVRGTIHWVSVAHAISAEVRLYDRLFAAENPNVAPEGQDFIAHLNPNSLEVRSQCWLEPNLASATVGDRFQFERLGYFAVDLDSTPEALVFNRTVNLKDSWSKVKKRG